jgi:hypothetical protein
MDNSRIEELARGPKDSVAGLDSRMVELKSIGAGILACILYVKINQGCSLLEARDIVTNSRAWADQKDEFLQHQADMFQEFVDDNMDRIESIQMTITPDGTDAVARMNRDQ